jgi:hypothetical protein
LFVWIVLNHVLYLVPYEMRVTYGVHFSLVQRHAFSKERKRCGKLKGGNVKGLNIEIVNFYIGQVLDISKIT